MTEVSGVAAAAAREREVGLGARFVAAAEADAHLESVLGDAHSSAIQFRQRLENIGRALDEGVARAAEATSTHAGSRAFAQFLLDKNREILRLLQEAKQSAADLTATVSTGDGYSALPGDPKAGSHDGVQELDNDARKVSSSRAGSVGTYTGDDLYRSEPSAADIKQDSIGDCYFDATIGAVASANPQWIKDRIHYDEATGNFNVSLWNGQDWQRIPVSQQDIQTDVEQHGASWRDNGRPDAPLWPSVLEAAYARLHCPGDSLQHALKSGMASGQSRDAMEALTGNQGKTIDPQQVWRTNQHIDQEISTALANRQPITLSTNPGSGPLVPSHTYSVEGLSGVGSDAQVTLRNPWEGNPGSASPLITVRLGDLIGSGLTGKLDDLGTHPVSGFNIGALG